MCKRVDGAGFRVIEHLPNKKKPNAVRTVEDMLDADNEKLLLHDLISVPHGAAGAREPPAESKRSKRKVMGA